MTMDKENNSSDTLDRSNISSLIPDFSSTTKDTKLTETKIDINKIQTCFCQQHTLSNIRFLACPALTPNFKSSAFATGQCHCQRLQLNGYEQKPRNEENKNSDWQRFNWKWPRQSYASKKDKSYEVKSKNKKHFRNDKPFGCCEKLGIPGNKAYELKDIIKNPIKQKLYLKHEAELPEKIEIYYFDHGNSAYYRTTDIPPVLTSEAKAEKTALVATRFWAEIFGYIHLAISFLTALILQSLRFLLFSIIRPLIIGTIQLVADYFVKPLLSIMFNGLIQPILILFYNIATSIRDCCEPIAAALGFFIKEFAVLFTSCRLVEVNNRGNNGDT
ncbi:uncharacterized protein LOC131671797 [Phymastichus coffea]|uniref:uncharacterized protein LOC131671797 n=1 Tax=Phymastichus coffea TaxID=108790 RepID=UPI00273C326D|nr:uncharacterized protein LOC131671797 [Phymastichus coffea]